ncbi:DNA-binding response regulator, partial [Mesorhizobium sp. M8A.F.Ca.ET.218.01.1.1]
MPEKSRFRILIGERNPLVVAALGDMISRDDRFDLVGSVQA